MGLDFVMEELLGTATVDCVEVQRMVLLLLLIVAATLLVVTP